MKTRVDLSGTKEQNETRAASVGRVERKEQPRPSAPQLVMGLSGAIVLTES